MARSVEALLERSCCANAEGGGRGGGFYSMYQCVRTGVLGFLFVKVMKIVTMGESDFTQLTFNKASKQSGWRDSELTKQRIKALCQHENTV